MPKHLVDERGAHLCPEAEYRDSLSDSEFWDHVFNGERNGGDYEYDPNEDLSIPPEVAAEYELEQRLANPCPECGQIGACAYDGDGRALIHVAEEAHDA